METKDRLKRLLDSTVLNGIDFVEIASSDQKTLRVHFLNTVAVQGTISDITITGGETIPMVAISNLAALQTHTNENTYWGTDVDGRPLLTLFVDAPGDFSSYTLTITSSVLDRFFNHVLFSFKALCPSDLDCEPTPLICPPEAGDIPPIDYLAKDFLSFRKALSDFSALRYPEWQERSEADFGMMFLEALSSLGDDLSYYQDRIAAEATLDTATQRRSVVRHARLVDYEPRPVVSARVLLQFDVTGSSLPSGLLVSAQTADGARIDFEAGTGLVDPRTGTLNQQHYIVSALWNSGITPYYWDDSQKCLPAGATEMWVVGDGFSFTAVPDNPFLIDTQAAISADPPIRELVYISSAAEETDPLFNNQKVTHIVWSQPLQYDHDLTRTTLAGNIVPATQGRRYTESFAIPPDPGTALPFNVAQIAQAIVRTGANSAADAPVNQYLFTLRNAPLAWLVPQDAPDNPPLPELLLTQQFSQLVSQPPAWTWRKSLLDAEPFENAFTLDPVGYTRITRNLDNTVMQDYDNDSGDTIRFGDGIFGGQPDGGDVFQLIYRAGGGASGNVAADTITIVDPSAASQVKKVTNPFAAQGGADREPDERVRRLAPQAFRAVQYRAVRPEDYEKAAQTLPWVLRAGTTFRWTGSWLTVFTTADPRGTDALPVAEHLELINLLNRYRLAGYESYTPAPHYVSLDLIITICARPDAFRSDVEQDVLSALSTRAPSNGKKGFFAFDNFTFGDPLERSALEAAIQNAYGVAGVLSIQYRQRGRVPIYTEMPDTVRIRHDEILRVDNDPSRPDRGSLRVYVEGGK